MPSTVDVGNIDEPEDVSTLVKKVVKSGKPERTKNLRSSYEGGFSDSYIEKLPAPARRRFEKAGIDLSHGYPERPPSEKIPIFLDEAVAIRNEEFPYTERGKNADPGKKALIGAAKEVRHLTKHIGTEIVGLQLSDLNDKQKDELALLIAERVVVFFRDQDLSPQKQLELGEYWGTVEKHAQQVHVPGFHGITVIWPDLFQKLGLNTSFKNSLGTGTSNWHTDLTHELQPPGITHLHNDTIPEVGGDTIWASGYAAYDKLSPAFQQFLEGKIAVYISAHQYINRESPLSGKQNIEREHPIIRTHPATGWKSLFVNRSMTRRIVGLKKEESDRILEYLFGVFEKNLDIQVRFNWKPTKEGVGTSALWDNRVSQHFAVWDFEGKEPRHGTRVSSLAEVPYFDPNSKSQREALGLSLE
ncbi:Piso0_004741 [Millerozyma farinosa CBS 7064]|uniref:Piso0_004741 protein n=1 Tax=Pichia sorbitophila (strain ATCC MYA-4447 / BCRC 22081 / CBS 7064 / NBRC 10061 / NRRL Y-12695) TaxID=559304 RepID=G8Y0A9_PICSO|nr:Piso0_004741 [Millerozyma farinosa CBS 7064]